MDEISVTKSGNYVELDGAGNNSKIELTKVKPKRNPGITTFEDFANEEKVVEEVSDASEEDVTSNVSEEDEENHQNEEEYNSGMEEEELEPSSGFDSIESEKQDLLYKLHRIKTKGIRLSKQFSMFSDIRELRAEVHKIRKDASVDASVKMGKKILLACVSGIEFLNNRYDPFRVDLDGWSESVMLNVGDGEYDGVLERLAEKYSGRGNSPPELELMLSLAGSAMMFHLTNTMMKGPKQDRTNMNTPVNIRPEPDSTPAPRREVPGSMEKREYSSVREMKGPSIDMSTLANSIGRFPPPAMNTLIKKPLIEDMSSSSEEEEKQFSDSASEMSKTIDTTVSSSGRRGRRRANISQEQTITL